MKAFPKSLRYHGPCVGIILVAVFVLFRKSLIPGWTLAAGDGSLGVFTWQYRLLPEGYFHVWATGFGLGYPSVPFSLTPGFLLAHVVPVAKFPDINYILHVMLMGVTGYYLVHDMTRQRFAALAGGLFLALQPHVVSHILPGHTGHFPMVGYIPGTVLFLRRAVHLRSVCYWGLAGLFFGLSVSAGTHDVCFFFALFLTAYGLFLLFQQRHNAGTGTRPVARTAVGMALALAIASAIGYQAIFCNLIQQVRRSSPQEDASGIPAMTAEQSWFWATQWSVPVVEAIDFAIPGFFGWGSSDPKNPYRGRIGQTEGYAKHKQGMRNLNDVNNYLGAVIMLGILLAVLHGRRNSEMWFFLTAALVTCLLAFGKYGPLYRLFYAIPYAGTIRNPIKWFYVTSLCAGVLGSMGLASAAEGRKGELRKSLKGSSLLFGTAWVVLVSIAGLCLASRPQAADIFWSNRSLVSLTSRALGLGAVLWLVGAALLAALRAMRPDDDDSVHSSQIPPKTFTPRLWLKSALVLLLFVELVHVNSHYLPYRRTSDIIQGGVLADFFNAKEKPFRIKMLGRHPLFNYINGLLVGYYDWEAVDPPSSRNVDDLQFFNAATLPRELSPTTLPQLKKNLQLTNVRYLLLPGLVKVDSLKPVLQLGTGQNPPPLVIYEFTEALPRHYLVHKWRVVEEQTEFFSSLSGAFDPTTEALINAPAADVPLPPPTTGSVSSCTLTLYDWYKAEMDVQTDQPAMLIVLDRYDPSWKAFVDDKPTQLFRANGMLRAIPVPAGTHKVRMEMAGTGPGPILSVISGWSAGLVCCVILLRQRRRKSLADEPTQDGAAE